MLRITELKKEFHVRGQSVKALDDVNLHVRPGEFFTLLGPSGCGKSTTLRCVAGLERPDSGEIAIDGEVLTSPKRFVPPYHRPVSVVFQSYAIWPHMNVFENVAYPLTAGGGRRSEGLSRSQVRVRVREALHAVGLEALEQRSSTELSGGQQQRVALARALVRRSKQWLLDEPLSNLDAKLRRQMRYEIKRLTRERGITTLFVTHDQVEALSMSDRLAVMQDGRIVQVGTPVEVYTNPNSRFVADFIGSINLVDGTLRTVDGDAGVGEVETRLGRMRARLGDRSWQAGTKVSVAIRPEHITISPISGPDPVGQAFPGVLDILQFVGDCWDGTATATAGDTVLQFRLSEADRLRQGEKVHIGLPESRCVLLPADR